MSLGARLLLGTTAILFGLVMLVAAPDDGTAVLFHGFAFCCACIGVACFLGGRARRFFASIAGTCVFAIGVWYFVAELPIGHPLSRQASDLPGAILFLAMFGVPGLLYAWKTRFGFAPAVPPLDQWFVIECDDALVTLRVSPPGKDPWTQAFPWSSIVRVCFRGEGVGDSDTLYVFTTQRPESYVIPTEGRGGPAFFGALVERGLFPRDLFAKAMGSTGGATYCWPPRADS